MVCTSEPITKRLPAKSLVTRSAIFNVFSAPTEMTNDFHIYYIPPQASQGLCAVSRLGNQNTTTENHQPGYLLKEIAWVSMKFGVTLKYGNLLLEAPEGHIFPVRGSC